MESIIKTLIIKKKGRKYFDCVVGNYTAQLVINDISKDLVVDRVVTLQVNDLSTRGRYGAALKFEPIAIIEDRDAESLREAAAARKDAEKWLGYAEGDAKQGLSRTNAIVEALKLCPSQTHLAARLAALQQQVACNAEAYAAQKRKWEEEKAIAAEQHKQLRSRRVLYPTSSKPGLHAPVRLGSQVVVFESYGKAFRIDENAPSVGGSHLLGHEGELGCYCYYRLADTNETRILEEREEKIRSEIEAQAAHHSAISDVREQIITMGEIPDGHQTVDGLVLLNSRNIYGGGEWFVITESHIWYIRNNGMDGDNWSANNVLTGGAGAIGWRVPYSQELAETLIALNDMNKETPY